MSEFAKMMNENDEPAFPQFDYGNAGKGMTLRDYFAGQALNQPYPSQWDSTWPPRSGDLTKAQQVSRWAYEIADAMLAERAK